MSLHLADAAHSGTTQWQLDVLIFLLSSCKHTTSEHNAKQQTKVNEHRLVLFSENLRMNLAASGSNSSVSFLTKNTSHSFKLRNFGYMGFK